MSRARAQLGAAGEAAAERMLAEAGLTVLSRRYRRASGEIDLIAEEGPRVVFVEVKTRRTVSHGSPAEAVTLLKQRRIARLALDFLTRRGWSDRPTRFDVVEVREIGGELQVHWIRDAFRLDHRAAGRGRRFG